MLLAHVDAGVGPRPRLRYPTLQMHVHDRQLFGLHGWMRTGRCVDLELTRELHLIGVSGLAHRPRNLRSSLSLAVFGKIQGGQKTKRRHRRRRIACCWPNSRPQRRKLRIGQRRQSILNACGNKLSYGDAMAYVKLNRKSRGTESLQVPDYPRVDCHVHVLDPADLRTPTMCHLSLPAQKSARQRPVSCRCSSGRARADRRPQLWLQPRQPLPA